MLALSLSHVSKTYRLYAKPFDRLKEALLRKPFHQPVNSLSDISFSAAFGETIGIIGENGAGKSTLLKILAKTLTPSSGEVVVNGRVAALLELGSGFHPEFTGRQNIHLNAALLGLSRAEIREKEPVMIEFADIGVFIDRPIKTYSSGMVMRLAFSIATSVDPDVLIVDEALSVGDQRFQQKCVERMMGFKESGKTIVVCSHSMYLINELCAKSLWLAEGRIRSQGKTSAVVSEYLNYVEEKNGKAYPSSSAVSGDSAPDVVIEDVAALDDAGNRAEAFRQFQTMRIRVKTRCIPEMVKGHWGIGIERADGQLIFASLTKLAGFEPIEFSGEQTAEMVIPNIPIAAGSYRIKAVVGDQHALRVIDERLSSPFIIQSERPELGMLWMEHQWHLN